MAVMASQQFLYRLSPLGRQPCESLAADQKEKEGFYQQKTMDLKGKVAFITGSGSGLGKAYAEKLLDNGAKVYITDISQALGEATLKEFQQKFGKDRCAFAVLDVTDEHNFDEVFLKAQELFGGIDIMVNNAGIVNEVDWNKSIQTNLASTIRGTTMAFQHMRRDKGGNGGRIINISSRAGLEDFYLLPVYTATKHGIRAYTTSMAQQPSMADQGIQLAVFCPDGTLTSLQSDFGSKIDRYQDHALHFLQQEMMTASEVARSFLYLLEQRDINGAILYVRPEGASFQKMERCDLGPKWCPQTQAQQE